MALLAVAAAMLASGASGLTTTPASSPTPVPTHLPTGSPQPSVSGRPTFPPTPSPTHKPTEFPTANPANSDSVQQALLQAVLLIVFVALAGLCLGLGNLKQEKERRDKKMKKVGVCLFFGGGSILKNTKF